MLGFSIHNWGNRIIPFAVECMSDDVKLGHDLIRYFDSFRILAGIQLAMHLKSRAGLCRADEPDDGLIVGERSSPPIHRDKGKQAVLNLVPFAGSRRKMRNCDSQASLIRQLLEFGFPQTNSRAVTSSRVSSDKELFSAGISVLSHHGPPSPNALDRKSSCVMVNPDTHPPRIVGQS